MHEPRDFRSLDIYDSAPPYVTIDVVPQRSAPPLPPLRPRRPRVLLPLILFLATCASTFYVGGGFHLVRSRPGDTVMVGVIGHWGEGLKYMASVMAVLLAHEMGHFLQAVRYHVPASLPFFIPMPFTPIGTMGAVIGMEGTQADRKQLFDIGLTGPLAGLALAVPLVWVGMLRANFDLNPQPGRLYFGDMLLVQWLQHWLRPEIPEGAVLVIDRMFFAGWVGLLITGLNMLPVSQLDGGHVAYALFGRYAHLLARGIMLLAIGYIAYARAFAWVVMLLLVMYIGTDHPPTRDDRVPIGRVRAVLGLLSLLLPLVCLTPTPISLNPM